MTLRVRGPAAQTQDSRSLAATPVDPPDDWLSRLVKLIPAEAIAFYGSVTARIPGPPDDPERVGPLMVAALVSAAVAVLVRYFATRDENGRPQWSAIVIALISFVLWVANLQFPAGPLRLDSYQLYVVGAFSLLWVTVVPYVYRGTPAPAPEPRLAA